MKEFARRELKAAISYSCDGGQALHIHPHNMGHPYFKRFPVIAHLFDKDKDRLIATAKKLGVRVIKVEREGQDGQHIDLCGAPLEKARLSCSTIDDVI